MVEQATMLEPIGTMRVLLSIKPVILLFPEDDGMIIAGHPAVAFRGEATPRA